MGGSSTSSGKRLAFYVPGMITIDGKKGLYPAISITGRSCILGCEHCKGYLLDSMIPCEEPEKLPSLLQNLESKGMRGALLTGGCLDDGRLPLLPYLEKLKGFNTGLYLTCHSGLNVSERLARGMKEAGIKQALIDVVGDEETFSKIYNLNDFSVMGRSLYNLYTYGPEVVPHIVVGVDRGRIGGEFKALDMVYYYSKARVVIVVFMPDVLKVEPPDIESVVEVFRYARKKFGDVSLGCARPRGRYRRQLEKRLIEEGLVDRIAIWSDTAIKMAEKKGYKVSFHYTCCSVECDDFQRD